MCPCAAAVDAAAMVKNKGKGGKNRRRGKADGDMKRELTFKEDGQGVPRPWPATRVWCPSDTAAVTHAAEYAQVTRMLGNGRLEAFCFDGVNRLCHIRGKLRKRVWIGVGDIVLLGLREFQDQKVARCTHRARVHGPARMAVRALLGSRERWCRACTGGYHPQVRWR